MLSLAVACLLLALICAVLGFGFLAGTAATIAKILILVFLVIWIIDLLRGRSVV